MNDVCYRDSTVTNRRVPKPLTQRTFHASIQEAGASRLNEEEIRIVTKALLILENRVVRKLGPGEILTNPQRVKEWLTLHYGMLDREVFGLIFLDLCVPLTYVDDPPGVAEIVLILRLPLNITKDWVHGDGPQFPRTLGARHAYPDFSSLLFD